MMLLWVFTKPPFFFYFNIRDVCKERNESPRDSLKTPPLPLDVQASPKVPGALCLQAPSPILGLLMHTGAHTAHWLSAHAGRFCVTAPPTRVQT